MAGYIPDSDETFETWQLHFVDVLANSTPANLGVLPAELTALQTQSGAFQTLLGDFQDAQSSARSARSAKDAGRQTLEGTIRPLVRRLQASPAMTDELRVALGITVADTTISRPAATTMTRPTVTVDTSGRLAHVLDFRDEATLERRAKPAGVRGCEIWVKIGGTPPAEIAHGQDPGDMRFLALDTATPYLAAYSEADAGKTAYYLCRWIASDGTKGLWSETVEATIVG